MPKVIDHASLRPLMRPVETGVHSISRSEKRSCAMLASLDDCIGYSDATHIDMSKGNGHREIVWVVQHGRTNSH